MKNEYDVAVVGGGLCGFSCALKSAMNGKEVLLVESRPALGWESTWAFKLDFNGASSPVAQKILDKLSDVGGIRDGVVDAPILEMTLDRLAKEANLSVLLYSYPVRLIFEDDTTFGVVLGSKSGENIIKAKVIVDATEKAVFWRQATENELSLDTVPARQTILFNHAEGEIDLPLQLSESVSLHPSVWDGEVRVEFEVEECSALTARRKIPEVIKLVREKVPQLKDALVSHIGNEPFPLTPMIEPETKSIEHPTIKNFFGAGIWTSDIENTPANRLALGEEVGEIVSQCEGVEEFPPEGEMVTGSFFRQSEIMSDVLVVGGGTSGSIAAIAAGRQGVKTTLLEASPSLGGVGTGGAIHVYCVGIEGGIQDEVDSRVKELTPLFAGKWDVSGFHPEAKKLVLQQMAEEANVDIILNTVMTGVLLEEGKVEMKMPEAETGTSIAVSDKEDELNELLEVIAVGSEGIAAYRAKAFIDSTGDGDVAAMAGAPFIIGREKDNLTHAFSQPAGRLDENGRLSFLNFDAGYVDPTDVEDLTRGRRLGINHYWFEKYTEENRKLYIAPIIGIRQSRQIIGEYQLTLADEIAGRRFDDGISFTKTFYDNHGFDYENESDEALLWVWALGKWSQRIGCEIPYRCLLPKNVDRLLLACRAISITYDAHAGLRMQRDLQRIGEAAGVAAALTSKNNITPREVDIEELRAILKESGVLDEKYRPQPAIPEYKAEIPEISSLDSEEARELALVASPKDSKSAVALRDMLSSDVPDMRFKASAVLALRGMKEGVLQLQKFVEERSEEEPEGRKTAPMWQAAIPFLGMAGDERAVPTLIDVLEDEDANLDALIAAVRALGRIGDRDAIPALRKLLERDELPTQRTFQVSSGGVQPVVEDAKWQLDLAVAEVLSEFGVPREEIQQIAEQYLDDERAYVRRYAKRVTQ